MEQQSFGFRPTLNDHRRDSPVAISRHEKVASDHET